MKKKLKKTILGFSVFLFANNYLLSGQNFCIPSFTGTLTYINNFAFHTLVNTYSGAGSAGYISYPDSLFSATVNIGGTYPITISTDYPSGIYGKFAAWIDYNNDSIFDNAELIHYDTISQYTTSGFVTIPNDTNFTGQRMLRVIYAWYPLTVTPCGNYSYGEAEDYLIHIVSNQPDTQTYCMPFNPLNMDNFIINDFHIGALINNSSGSNNTNYIIYPDNLFTANLALNNSYPVFVSKGTANGNTGGYALWIDLDNNGDFSVAENLFYAGPNLTSASGMVAIPNDTSFIGMRRLRVRSKWADVPTDPCGLAIGETEDYLVNITGSPAFLLNHEHSGSNILIYPNPSDGNVHISSIENIDEIKVTDLTGRINYISKPGKQNFLLNIKTGGVYFVTITNRNETATQKLIVKK